MTGQALFDATYLKVLLDKNKLGILNKNGVNCVIYQQSLFPKQIGMNSIINIPPKIITKIKGGYNALTYRKFQDFYRKFKFPTYILLYTESVIKYTQNNKSIFFIIFYSK